MASAPGAPLMAQPADAGTAGSPVRGGGDRSSRLAMAGALVGVCGAGLLLSGMAGPGLALLAGVVGVGVWRRRRRRATRTLGRALQAEAASGVVDLLGACLLAGLNGHLALLRVAERCPPPLAAEFRVVTADLRVGRFPSAALRGAAQRTGLAELHAAAGALEAAERWGAPPAEALAARAEALRTRLRLAGEAAAGRAAVRLTFPLVLCFLPAFVLLTVVPMLAGAVQALHL